MDYEPVLAPLLYLAYAQVAVHVVTPVLDKQATTHTQTNKQTKKHTHTHTQTNKQTNKQANKQTSKQFNKFLFSDYFQVLSEFALVNTSFRMKILCITGKVLKSSTMVLMYQSLSKIKASRFVICAHPTRTGE